MSAPTSVQLYALEPNIANASAGNFQLVNLSRCVPSKLDRHSALVRVKPVLPCGKQIDPWVRQTFDAEFAVPEFQPGDGAQFIAPIIARIGPQARRRAIRQ